MDNTRPNPDELLRQIQADEKQNGKASKRGRLKIFLGFCAGVGKTYYMLQETGVAAKNGVNTLIGIVETHGRKETQALLEGLEILPRKKIMYNGLVLEEMDIDKLLEMKPELAIVDELAHTNVPNSRHEKRYQDVEELLNAGINVYTTLNIQHIESMVDIVHQISYVKVHETVPDSFIELADEIELVDLTPEKLIERLKEGKVYIPAKAAQAMQKFFRMGNLLALRELALRYTAKRVDEDMLSYKSRYSITTPWPVGARLLVGFSPSTTSERLLRITHRMAVDMDADWYAVYVESPQQVEMSEASAKQLNKNIRLAQELGAKVAALSGNVIADEIINFAKEKNVTLIVAGLSYRSRLEEILKGSVLSDLTKKSGQINVLIVGNEPSYKKTFKLYQSDIMPYLMSLLMILAIAALGWAAKEWVSFFNFALILLLPVIASSIWWGTRVGLFTAVTAFLGFDFFFIPPLLTFRISDLKYFPSFVVFLIIAVILSLLGKNIRRQNKTTRNRERFLSSLNFFSREIITASNLEEILDKAVTHICEAFHANVIILLPDSQNQLQVRKKRTDIELSEKEKAVATWVYRNGSAAGKNSQTLCAAHFHYLPLIIEEVTYGVIAISAVNDEPFSTEQYHLLESFANIIAICLRKQ